MLPLGIVIPTKNSMAYLPRHVEGLRPWLDLVEQIVVVDSFSNDGTLDFLQRNLSHPRVTYTTHPPGLYASWNHGIAQVRSRHVYISTVGDTITRAGLEMLVHTAEALDCDVVVSKPYFCDANGRFLPDILWPVDDIIATLGGTAPRKLHKLEAVIFAAVHATGALTGSCASCVFRTATLQRFPFPTEFGGAGDGAWGVVHAAEVNWGIVAQKISTFLMHPPDPSSMHRQPLNHVCRMDGLLCEAAQRWQREGVMSPAALEAIGWKRLTQMLANYLALKSRLNEQRHGAFPWIMNPFAWLIRTRRALISMQLRHIQRRALAAALLVK